MRINNHALAVAETDVVKEREKQQKPKRALRVWGDNRRNDL